MVESRGKQEGGEGERKEENRERISSSFFFSSSEEEENVSPRPRIAKFSHEVVEFLPMPRSCNASLLIGDRDFSN